jgi:hypothetical protein
MRSVIKDIREAVRDPDEADFLCYRAIETIQKYFCNSGVVQRSEHEGWKLLREALRVDKEFITKRIKATADPRRHGEVHGIGRGLRIPQLMATRSIINRFVAYVIRGKLPLPDAEFPTLKAD